jgi:hypothetical protein
MQARVAVLEQITLSTQAALERIERGQATLATELRAEIRDLRVSTRQDFYWLFGVMLAGFTGLLGVMAHGFHWL